MTQNFLKNDEFSDLGSWSEVELKCTDIVDFTEAKLKCTDIVNFTEAELKCTDIVDITEAELKCTDKFVWLLSHPKLCKDVSLSCFKWKNTY